MAKVIIINKEIAATHKGAIMVAKALYPGITVINKDDDEVIDVATEWEKAKAGEGIPSLTKLRQLAEEHLK